MSAAIKQIVGGRSQLFLWDFFPVQVNAALSNYRMFQEIFKCQTLRPNIIISRDI